MDLDLLLYSLWYPPYTWGGVGTQTYDLAHSLARLGVRVTVICGGSKIETDQRENLNVIRLPTVELQPRFLWFQLRNRNVEIFREKLRYSDILLMAGYWWLTVLPGCCSMLMVLSANLLGDWLRVKFDPQLRQL